MMRNAWIFAIAVAGLLLFGCPGNGDAAPTPVEPPVACAMDVMECPDGSYVGRVPPECNFAPCPSAQATPSPTATPGGGTPEPTPTPGAVPSLSDITGCSNVGISYTYRMITEQGSVDMAYRTADGGIVNGVPSVLKTYTTEVGGMSMVTKQWDAKSDCRCLKMETQFMGSTMPGECPPAGTYGGASGDAQSVVTVVGVENISVPAYTGPATRYRVVTTSGGASHSSEYWTTPSIPLALKMTSEGMSMELIEYSG